MKDWLTKLAEQNKTADENLLDALESLPPSMLEELAMEFDPSLRPTQMDDMQEKIASAVRMGQELAQERGEELEKQAFIPLIAGAAARMAGGAALKGGLKSVAGGIARDAAKDMVVNGATKAIGNAVRPPAGNQMGAASGGFNYGKVAALNLGGIGRQAAGFFHRNPGAAVTLAGAGAGALMAPRDPETGQKQYMRGALMGGGLAAGANALSQGRIADKAKHMVTRQNNPIFGQGARRYMTESAYATRPGAKATAQAAAPSGASAADAAAQKHVNDYVGGAAAMRQAPRAQSDMERFRARAQEHVEMGQLRNQMSQPSELPQPQSAAFKAYKPGIFSRFSSPASVGGAGAAPAYHGGPVSGQVKVGFVLGGLAGYGAAGPDREASPRSGFWRGSAGGILGGALGAGIGGAIDPHGVKGTILGGLAGQLGGGYLAGRTARPTDEEIEVHHAGELAKIKAKQKASKEKTAYLGPDQLIGGFIGHNAGKKQVERGEEHSFGGKQVASILIPGGAGYQLGRYIAHNDAKKEKKAEEQKTDLDRARKWGRTGALAGVGYTAAVTPGILAKAKNLHQTTGHKIPNKLLAGAIVGGGALNAAQGYGVGRLAHRVKHGPATGKPIEKKATIFSTKIAPAAAGAAVRSGMGGVAGRAAAGAVPTAARRAATPPPIPAAAQQSTAGQRAWQNSPFKAPPRPSAVQHAQQQLNTAKSVAGGGPLGTGHATINALPGSGW